VFRGAVASKEGFRLPFIGNQGIRRYEEEIKAMRSGQGVR
jgi:hypothetical protein